MQEFLDSCDEKKVAVLPLKLKPEELNATFINRSLKSITKNIRRICGVLIIGKRPEREWHPEKVASLFEKKLDKVVWFDLSSRGWPYVRNKKISRCYVSEKRICKEAATHLIRMGHQKAAFFVFPKSSELYSNEWQYRRAKLIQEFGQKYKEGFSCDTLLYPINPELETNLASVEWAYEHLPQGKMVVVNKHLSPD